MIQRMLKPNVLRGAVLFTLVATAVELASLLPIIGCILLPFICAVWLASTLATGWLVARWGQRMKGLTQANAPRVASTCASPQLAPAFDGAIATGIGAFISAIITWTSGFILSRFFATLGAAVNSPNADWIGVGIAAGPAYAAVLFLGLVLAVIGGAVGGFLYGISTTRRPALT